MKHFSAVFLLIMTFMAQTVFGAFPPTTSKSQLGSKSTTFNFEAPNNQFTKTSSITGLIETGNDNMLFNPDFEAEVFSSGYDVTISTPLLVAAAGSDIWLGKSATWDPTSGIQTLNSSFVPISNGMAGNNCEVSLWTKVPSGASAYKFQVINQSYAVIAEAPLVATDTTFSKNTITFACPMTGSVAWALQPTSNEPLIAMDHGYIGLARNVGSGTISTPWQAYTPVITGLGTGSVASSFGMWRRAGDTLEIMYNWTKDGSAGTGSSPIYTSLPSGFTPDTSKMPNAAAISDGEVFTSLNLSLSQLVESNGSGGYWVNRATGTIISGGLVTAGSYFRGSFKVPIQGWVASTVVTANQQRTPKTTILTSGSGTFTTTPGAVYLHVRARGGGGGGGASGSGAWGTPGSGGNTTFGTSLIAANGGAAAPVITGGLAGGGNGGGATVTAPAEGLARAGGGGGGANTNSGGTYPPGGSGGESCGGGRAAHSNAIVKPGAAQANSGAGGAGAGMSSTSGTAGSGGGGGGCVDAIVPNPLSSYPYVIGAGGAGGTAGTNGAAGGDAASGVIEITEYFGYTTALLANSVTTDLASGEKLIRVGVDTICSTSPCSIARNSGFTNIVRTSTGNYSANFSVPFSSPPECFGNGGSSVATFLLFSGPTTTSVGFQSFAGAGIADNGFRIWCVGPR